MKIDPRPIERVKIYDYTKGEYRIVYIRKHLPLEPKQEEEMDKKIKKVLSKEKGAVKETKELLKMDKKMDNKMDKMKKKAC